MQTMYTSKINMIDDLETLPVLDEVREIFYKNTGLIMSFHYAGVSKIDFYPSYEKNDYCRLIQSCDKGMRRCHESDGIGLREARMNGGYCIYECHAGLTDVVIPLMYKGKELGSIYTGQVSVEPVTEEQFNKIYESLEDLNIDRRELWSAYQKVKIVDLQKLKINVRFLSLIANYIISVENELVLQKEIVKKNRLLHKKERETLRLEKELKDLTISVLDFKKREKETDEDTEDLKQTHEHIVLRAQLFIKSNFNNNITLEDVANAVYLSPNYFSTIFKEISGYNFSSYLTQTRVDAAKDLLKKTSLPIKEIVSRVGFEDYNYFNKVFKSIVKVPPGQYRKTNSEQKHRKIFKNNR